MSQKAVLLAGLCVALVLFLTVGCSSIERKLLFFPSHDASPQTSLKPWVHQDRVIGYARTVPSPKNVWLMLHGNGGQASMRDYALGCFSGQDSVYVVEYPGYGTRKGTPSRDSFNQAAKEAYLLLREAHPRVPVCVVGESIGNGPSAALAGLDRPPDKFVLLTPYEKLSNVAADHYPKFLVSLLLRDNWDNVAALSSYRGPIDIYAARNDTIIPPAHAESLAVALPQAKLIMIDGGHNDWSSKGKVSIRNP